jgi:hypothetical protein
MAVIPSYAPIRPEHEASIRLGESDFYVVIPTSQAAPEGVTYLRMVDGDGCEHVIWVDTELEEDPILVLGAAFGFMLSKMDEASDGLPGGRRFAKPDPGSLPPGARVLTEARLERLMQILRDVKKDVTYDKASGEWFWHDRGDGVVENWQGPFGTFLAAVEDAVEPYLEGDAGEEE